MNRQARQQDSLNHMLGGYIRVAHHEPNKYPAKPTLSDDKSNKTVYTDDEAFERIARIKYGKKK